VAKYLQYAVNTVPERGQPVKSLTVLNIDLPSDIRSVEFEFEFDTNGSPILSTGQSVFLTNLECYNIMGLEQSLRSNVSSRTWLCQGSESI
jgi:hypothetical protein